MHNTYVKLVSAALMCALMADAAIGAGETSQQKALITFSKTFTVRDVSTCSLGKNALICLHVDGAPSTLYATLDEKRLLGLKQGDHLTAACANYGDKQFWLTTILRITKMRKKAKEKKDTAERRRERPAPTFKPPYKVIHVSKRIVRMNGQDQAPADIRTAIAVTVLGAKGVQSFEAFASDMPQLLHILRGDGLALAVATIKEKKQIITGVTILDAGGKECFLKESVRYERIKRIERKNGVAVVTMWSNRTYFIDTRMCDWYTGKNLHRNMDVKFKFLRRGGSRWAYEAKIIKGLGSLTLKSMTREDLRVVAVVPQPHSREYVWVYTTDQHIRYSVNTRKAPDVRRLCRNDPLVWHHRDKPYGYAYPVVLSAPRRMRGTVVNVKTTISSSNTANGGKGGSAEAQGGNAINTNHNVAHGGRGGIAISVSSNTNTNTNNNSVNNDQNDGDCHGDGGGDGGHDENDGHDGGDGQDGQDE